MSLRLSLLSAAAISFASPVALAQPTPASAKTPGPKDYAGLQDKAPVKSKEGWSCVAYVRPDKVGTKCPAPAKQGRRPKMVFHGTVYSLHRGGAVEWSTKWQLGKRHGAREKFTKKGVRIQFEQWAKHQKHGPVMRYNKHGALEMKGQNEDGDPTGTWTHYHVDKDKTGPVRRTVAYSNKGKDRVDTFYARDGKVTNQWTYKDGKRVK